MVVPVTVLFEMKAEGCCVVNRGGKRVWWMLERGDGSKGVEEVYGEKVEADNGGS